MAANICRCEKVDVESSLGTQTMALSCTAEVASPTGGFSPCSLSDPQGSGASYRKIDASRPELHKNGKNLSVGMWAEKKMHKDKMSLNPGKEADKQEETRCRNQRKDHYEL